MPEINIDLKVTLRLLSNLKPDKAPDPDGIKPLILKIALATLFTIPGDNSTGKIPSDWTKANVSPVFKKGRKVIQPIIGPSP